MKANDSLPILLRNLGLSLMEREHEDVIVRAEKENWGYRRFLHYLAEVEASEKLARKIQRLLKDSDLPPTETLERLDQAKMPEKARRMLPTLLSGDWVARGDHILAIGLHGRGKTAYCAALARGLIERHQMKVLFIPTFKLANDLSAAYRDGQLPEAIERLHRYDVIHLDELGYTQQAREQSEVLFQFFSERHQKQRSIVITSNLVFSQWDTVFKESMMTAAVVDRLVERAIILEFTGESLRVAAAEKRRAA